MKVVVAGATGFVGVKLVERLNALGNQVTVLARNPKKAVRQFPKEFFPHVEVIEYEPLVVGEWAKSLAGADAVVNLAGTPIADKPWTADRKQEILQSRQIGTRRLVEAIGMTNPKPPVLVSGSAIGYYGTSETKEFDEYSFPGEDFLAEVCKAWEVEADAATSLGVRVVKLRTGIVLGNGGALDKILPLFQLGLGGKIGSGKQWFAWIHRDDLVNLIIFAINTPQIVGALNGTAPNPITNLELTAELAKLLSRPAFLPVPAIALQLVLGEAGKLVLEGQKVLPKKAEMNHFAFQYPTIDLALKQIIG